MVAANPVSRGCVSGSQMTKLREACEQDGDKYDFDVIDGYDELG